MATERMKLHIEITKEQAAELLAEATNGLAAPVKKHLEKSDALRRQLIRNAILERLP